MKELPFQPRLRGFRERSQRSLASGGAAAWVDEKAILPKASAIAWVRTHWALLIVLLAFACSALIVPTFAPVATTDDWAYARSAQILLEEGRLTVFPVVAATAVFQIAWGALFGLLFGPTFGAFRLSTVVITALGALALYGLCRDLGVSPRRGALGVAAYLFNPLVFVLAFTFMTDAHFVALLVIATWLFAKALVGSDDPSPTPTLTPNPSPGSTGEGGRGVRDYVGGGVRGSLLAASAVSALAFLTRQQGALIVPAVILFLLLTRRLRFDRASFLLLIQIVALPIVAAGGYFLWLRFGNDVPRVQVSFFREVLEEGWSGTWWLVQRLAVVDLLYLGLFTLPLMVAALPFARELMRGISWRGGALFTVWAAIAVVGVMELWMRGARMPYVAQFFGAGGLGAPDVLGSRPILITPEMRGGLTVVCLIASLLLALVAARAVSPSTFAPRPRAMHLHLHLQASPLHQARAGLVLCIGLGQVLGVFPPSYHYIGWAAGSLDRYLLPLVPLAVALALWGLRGVRLALPLGWALAIAMALFAVAGTRDYLVFMREVWAMGDRAVAAGVSLTRLDAGSGWDGYHLYEYGQEYRIRSRTPKGGPWWVYFYAPATDSSYVVAGKRLPGHFVVERRQYSSWLLGKPANLFLQRRRWAPWPPNALPKAILTRPAPGGLQTVPEPVRRPTSLPMPTITPGDEPRTGAEAGDA
jgi:4-amino-4-deoxy-L-arabinose transferase-like glycosyltransferase